MLPRASVQALCRETYAALQALTEATPSTVLGTVVRQPSVTAACQAFEAALLGDDLDAAREAALRYQHRVATHCAQEGLCLSN